MDDRSSNFDTVTDFFSKSNPKQQRILGKLLYSSIFAIDVIYLNIHIYIKPIKIHVHDGSYFSVLIIYMQI